jgi:hypothetical protein
MELTMARKKLGEPIEAEAPAGASANLERTASGRTVPLVFISHDSRDADLAEAFDHLLTDASGGVIQTFRSSDQSGRAGIDYGENWFSKITNTLSDATDVVALLTPNSVGRPWILFEAGFAVGRLDAKVFGIAVGLPLSKAVAGPFAQFQNCEANEESLATVVLKLIQRNPNARPREQAVRRQVSSFLLEISPLLKQGPDQEDTEEEMGVAKLFEEVKVMFRDLPSRVQSELRGDGLARRRRRLHPRMLEEFFHVAQMEDVNPSLPWLMVASVIRDDVPWVAEAAVEIHRALQGGNPEQVEMAYQNMQAMLCLMSRSKVFHRFERDDEDSFFLVRHLPDLMSQFMATPALAQRKGRRVQRDLSPSPNGDPETEK